MITRTDIIDSETFTQRRPEWRQQILALKKTRRIALGPDVTLYFENRATLLWQIQEMLYIEKGGEEQIDDELAAYAPLEPNGKELVATVMIEIADPVLRAQKLAQLGHFEFSLILRFAGHILNGMPEDDMDRTNENGKTSSVHFIRWSFTPQQVLDFQLPNIDVIIECIHSRYKEKTILSPRVHESLKSDFKL
ncbi:DUF3501 family protein [Candidatus Odyssella acanthamoebae]|uniref:DUF3501 family protein n=1 Tax=Candidatus Odyssella acanthamoebae TaxID=91604 RepID=A0A077B297_9PROT|nr:DUF3501 family protein [Candidatus Paracaedibacter acanthamoebae]AIK97100.1 hypothetical protein ID47_10735 [Candidatus Paracaedibacter acanthamoebae]